MKYLITGGTGFLGGCLTDFLLENGNEVVVLSRGYRKSTQEGLDFVYWDGKKIPGEDIGPVDVVINLAGASIADKAWTDEYKRDIIGSRTDSSEACVNYIQSLETKPLVFIAGSAIGIYGADRQGAVDESSKPGTDYLADVCMKWEKSSEGAGIRTIFLRTGVVLGEEGPLEVMMKPFKMFAGGPIADGKQFLPWIHIADWVAAVMFLISNPTISGAVNVVAPRPVRNEKFSEVLARVLNRPNLFRVPKFVLNFILGEKAVIAWGSMEAYPKALEKAGFKFGFPDIESALKDLVG